MTFGQLMKGSCLNLYYGVIVAKPPSKSRISRPRRNLSDYARLTSIVALPTVARSIERSTIDIPEYLWFDVVSRSQTAFLVKAVWLRETRFDGESRRSANNRYSHLSATRVTSSHVTNCRTNSHGNGRPVTGSVATA